MNRVAIGLIRIYQWCLSPFIGDVCHFSPTCSHYAIEALKKHGFLRGSWLTLKRIIRCNPWCGCSGEDPVP